MMMLTTTRQTEGHTIHEYKGLVTGGTIVGANFAKDFFAGVRDIVGIDIDYDTIGETCSMLMVATSGTVHLLHTLESIGTNKTNIITSEL